MMNVAYINTCTETEGPYKRLAIWFQGCNKRCKECCNIKLQPLKIANLMSVNEIVDIIIESKNKYDIEGVTFLGGEPTLQKELAILAKKIKELNLGVILFTGYNLSEIDYEIIKYCDLIVDGEFDVLKIDTNRNMIGSTNQTINLINDRYKNVVNWFLNKRNKEVEINLYDHVLFNGDVF